MTTKTGCKPDRCFGLTTSHAVCQLTRKVSAWAPDADGCPTRTVSGGVCAKHAEQVQQEAA